MKAFDFKDVTINSGLLKDTLDETMDFYLGLSNDDIMKYMRERAGRPAPGIRFTGWYANSGGLGNIGQWLSAYSRMYAITGNEAFKEKAIFLADDFWLCYQGAEDKDPFFGFNSHYSIEKLLTAYCDLDVYCGYMHAKEHCSALIDYAYDNLNDENIIGNNGNEWYTLPESCLDAWEHFQLPKALELAKRFEYKEFWNLFYKDEDPFSKHPLAGLYSEFFHAYSHTNSFNSCARSYEVTKNPYYLKAMRTFYRFMQNEEVMATGGFGPNFEHLMPKNRIIDALRTGHDSFETQCDTYAAYRLCKYMTRFTGEAAYGNWVERLLFNATAATIPMTPDGKVIYYSDYNMYGAQKINRQDGWTCCTRTRPLLVAEMQRLIYFEDKNNLFVSQYVPSTLSWNRCEQTITVTQDTAFPLEDSTRITLSMKQAAEFSICLRMPSWLDGSMTVTCNGTPIESTVNEGGWLCCTALFQNGDVLEVTLPQNVWMHSFDPLKNGPNAFLHGPVVLAAKYTGLQTPNDRMDVQALVEKMRPVEGKPLHYTVDGIDTLYFKPFYEFEEYERYFIYHDTTAHATKIHKKKK